MDSMVQVDVVKCFDSIDHRLLLEHLSKLLGTDNAPLIDLINCFLKTPRLSKKGNDYSNSEVGLPQGSPISPVLIQSFLHQLDLQFDAMAQEENGDSTKYVYFARYADDILFGIPIVGVGVMSKVFFRRLQEVLDRMSSKLRLKLTSIVLQRWRAPAVEEGKDRFANQIIGCYIQTHEMLDVICSKVKTGLLFVPIERLFTKGQESFSFAIE